MRRFGGGQKVHVEKVDVLFLSLPDAEIAGVIAGENRGAGVPGVVLGELPGDCQETVVCDSLLLKARAVSLAVPGQFPRHYSRHSLQHTDFPRQSPQQSPQQFWGIANLGLGGPSGWSARSQQ